MITNAGGRIEFEKHQYLKSETILQVCSVIMDTGFNGSADDYVRKYYNKGFEELRSSEAELIIQALGNKPGSLVNEFA